jgi:hypothetical protein
MSGLTNGLTGEPLPLGVGFWLKTSGLPPVPGAHSDEVPLELVEPDEDKAPPDPGEFGFPLPLDPLMNPEIGKKRLEDGLDCRLSRYRGGELTPFAMDPTPVAQASKGER